MQNPDDVKQLSQGRTAYWNDKEKMVVIHDPKSPGELRLADFVVYGFSTKRRLKLRGVAAPEH